jgi:membrane associated rhomboid family serine protease
MFPIRDDQPSYSTPYVNYLIITLNVLIFLFEVWVGQQSRGALNSLVGEFGVVPRRFALDLGRQHIDVVGAFFPILTSMFLHGGWLHVLGNMWFLYIFGDNIEDQVGHFPYLIFYLVCGIAAALTHIALNVNSRVPSVGASGAIAGVMGAYLVLYPRAKVLTLVFLLVFFTFWQIPAWFFLIYWFALQFIGGTAMSVADTAQGGGVAFWAHVGGFLAGVILIKLMPQRPRRYPYRTY